MKFRRLYLKHAVPVLLSCLLLAGCGDFRLQAPQAQQFHPLDSEMAMMAAPDQPVPEKQLNCLIGHGDARFSKGWSKFSDAEFTLAPALRVSVPLNRATGGETVTIMGLFDMDGQKLIFCPIVDGPPGARISCASVYALDDDLATGIKRTFDIPEAIRGAEITCSYKESGLKKL